VLTRDMFWPRPFWVSKVFPFCHLPSGWAEKSGAFMIPVKKKGQAWLGLGAASPALECLASTP
jgi:hypothetical protein